MQTAAKMEQEAEGVSLVDSPSFEEVLLSTSHGLKFLSNAARPPHFIQEVRSLSSIENTEFASILSPLTMQERPLLKPIAAS